MSLKTVFQNKKISGVFGVVSLALLLGGCIVEPAPVAYVRPPPPQGGVVVVEDNLVYYPDYEVYYSPVTRFYWYRQGGGWVTGPRVPGISVDVLLAAPSVRMNFRDSPANHHAMVVRRYPHGWRPADEDRRP